jgi:hypothetical protein
MHFPGSIALGGHWIREQEISQVNLSIAGINICSQNHNTGIRKFLNKTYNEFVVTLVAYRSVETTKILIQSDIYCLERCPLRCGIGRMSMLFI